MTKWIKFTLSKGDPITLEKELAERLIDSEGQLMKIPDPDGSWSGKLINKAHIVSTDEDRDRTRLEAEKARQFIPKLNEPEPTPEQKKKVEEIKEKIRDKFKIKK